MTKQEFTSLLKTRTPSEDSSFDWSVVELVYNFHPAFSYGDDPENKIAGLYDRGGMALMNDMLPLAVAVKEKEDKLEEIRSDIDELQERLNNVQNELDELREL